MVVVAMAMGNGNVCEGSSSVVGCCSVCVGLGMRGFCVAVIGQSGFVRRYGYSVV